MPNTIYSNFYLSNEIEDQYNSRLSLLRFATVDNSLVGTAGMIRKINVYSATDGVEKLEMGKGNTKSIEVSFAPKEYKITLAQGRFEYYDEELMTDPTAIQTGINHIAVDMFNTVNADIYAELMKATLTASAGTPGFDAFVDAAALIPTENVEGQNLFAILAPSDMAAVRKALKDTLQYNESYARTGYVGSVAGIDLYAKKDATAGTIVVADRKAVTVFNKKGTEVEQSLRGSRSAEDANIRKNSIYGRKYYLAALTDATRAVKLTIGG